MSALSENAFFFINDYHEKGYGNIAYLNPNEFKYS